MCEHSVIYHCVVDIMGGDRFLGAVDLWRCRKCDLLFAEARRIGEITLAPKVGFAEPPSGSKWAILVCGARDAYSWELLAVEVGKKVEHHPCAGTAKVDLVVSEGFRLDPRTKEHRLFLLEGYVNESLDLEE